MRKFRILLFVLLLINLSKNHPSAAPLREPAMHFRVVSGYVLTQQNERLPGVNVIVRGFAWDAQTTSDREGYIDSSMRQRIRAWVDFNLSIDNLANKKYFETQNFFESRVRPSDPVIAQIHATPGYSRAFTVGLTFQLFNKGN